MQVLDDHTAATVRSLCELMVPGSARVGPEVYLDALLARMPEPERERALAAFAALAPAAGAAGAAGAADSADSADSADGASALAAHALTPEFMLVRALACEAFYSDFVAPGAPGPGAYEEIGFTIPLAARVKKDWSYLGIPT